MAQSEIRDPEEIAKILAESIKSMDCTLVGLYRLFMCGWGKEWSDDETDANFDAFFDSMWNADAISGDEALEFLLSQDCSTDKSAFISRYGAFLAENFEVAINEKPDWLTLALLSASYWREAASAFKEQDIPKVWRCLIEANMWFGNATGRASHANPVAWLASRGAHGKHAKYTEPDKALVRECWLDWQKNPSTYKNKVSFDRDMLEKMQNIKDIRTVTKWRIELQKEYTPC